MWHLHELSASHILQGSAASSRAQIAFSVVHHEGKGALSSGWHPGRYGVATGHLQHLHRQLHAQLDDESPTSAAGEWPTPLSIGQPTDALPRPAIWQLCVLGACICQDC